MKIEPNKVVTLSYILHTGGFDGEEVERTTDDKPLQFIYGVGMMLPAFEKNLEGLQEGDKFQFKLSADEAYGQPSDENIADIPMEAFMEDGKVPEGLLEVGKSLTLQDQNGNFFNGKITKIGLDSVTMDFNHPMAGKDLYFTGEVLEVRDATDEELAHGHVH